MSERRPTGPGADAGKGHHTASGREICALASEAPAFAARLRPRARKRRLKGVLDHVAPAAHGFAAGLVLHAIERSGSPRRVWLIASDIRAQESLSQDLSVWWGTVLFYPEHEDRRIEGALPDEETHAERLALLQRIAEPPAGTEAILLTPASLSESVPRPNAVNAQRIVLRAGTTCNPDDLAKQLEAAGYDRVPQVGERGQFAMRGGILDVYPWQSGLPVRAEFFDRDIESLRQFDPDSQISVGTLDEALILLHPGDENLPTCLLEECIGPDDTVVTIGLEPMPRADYWIGTEAGPGSGAKESFDTACHDQPAGTFDAGDFVIQQARRAEFVRQIRQWRRDGWRVCMFFHNEGEIQRFRELMEPEGIDEALPEALLGHVNRGFTVPSARLAVLSDAEIFGRYQHVRARRLITGRRPQRNRRAPLDLSDIADGDLVVHQEYGIGRFRGLARRATTEGHEEDVVVLEYANGGRLFVPLPQAWLISRYAGAGKTVPELNTLGDGRWNRARKAAERSVLEYAERMLRVQAERQTGGGFAFPPDNRWQVEFEQSFLYRETDHQLQAIADTKRDMESEKPMDRLICGDVGFGKTEVAIRAAFKAVMGGKQVAVLAPTTVLSQQHYHNFRERMSDYPVRVDVLNRFRTPAESRKILSDLAKGDIDILIGTHRLISADVLFRNLGLVVIDEEQRFGVKHKETFKELFRGIDVLTLSATPIPRTLYLALMGVRDMSTIDTPPPNRTPVETIICAYDERIIRSAIERELKRRGQVFFLHNRIGSMERVAGRIRELSPPGTRVGTGHGKMPEGMLEDVMNRFVNGEIDVLVSTTIIESGIDIPNANTIIIDRADLFGLADLYQLRGRVGRAGHKAYAYLMLPRSKMTTGDARKRINAMKQYTALGSGFRIAMRDLEIRGAGNLLGTKQSGHIAAVGFDLYCRMLREAVSRLQGKPVPGRVETTLKIDFIAFSEAAWLASGSEKIPAFLPASFVPEVTQRIPAYRQLAELSNVRELAQLRRQWRDRFGRFPHEVENLLRCTELRLEAHRAGISLVEIRENKLMLTRNGDFILIGGKFPRLRERAQPHHRLIEAINLVKQL